MNLEFYIIKRSFWRASHSKTPSIFRKSWYASSWYRSTKSWSGRNPPKLYSPI